MPAHRATADLTMDVRLTVRLVADVGVSPQALMEYVASHQSQLREELVEKVRLRAEFFSAFLDDNAQVYVDDLIDVEAIG